MYHSGVHAERKQRRESENALNEDKENEDDDDYLESVEGIHV